MILDLEETKSWLRVDGLEEDITIGMLIGASEEYLKNATGKEFESNNNLAKLFCLILVSDWYENRELVMTTSLGRSVSEKIRRTVESMLLQLQYCEGDQL